MKLNLILVGMLLIMAMQWFILILFLYGNDLNKKTKECGKSKIVFKRIDFSNNSVMGEISVFELQEGEKAVVTAEPRTANGNPAKYELGSVSWETSDETVMTVTPNPDNELQAEIECIDGSNNETVTITCRLDGDPDADDVRELVGAATGVATQGEATVFALSVKTPQSETGDGGESETSGGTVGESTADA